ncbi:MAG: hypothetical protein H7Y37_08000 [Anaerolineae bacterium]|nr:hypothetical protein [Gloeobacterales cyanobacterium ES-bin-313]
MSDLSWPSCGFHLELRVAQLERSTQFYRNFFDREPRAVIPKKYSLFEFWNLQLLLLAGKAEKVRFGFQLHSVEQLSLWEKQLFEREISVTRQQMHHPELNTTETALNIIDPDGNRCSFYVLLRAQPLPAPTTGLDSDSQSS